MSCLVVDGREALAALLRLIADHIETGAVNHPPSIMPAPHLGPMVVRVGGIDYDLAAALPGCIPEGDDGDTPATAPGKRRR